MGVPLPKGWGQLPSASDAPPADSMGRMIHSAASMAGVPFDIAHRLVKQESGFNPRAHNPTGAAGLTQLMPETAKELGVSDVYNPADNLAGGMKYLAQQHKKYGNWRDALAAYNWGPGNVDSWLKRGGDIAHLPGETRAYIAAIAPTALTHTAPPQQVAQAPKHSRLDKMSRRVAPPKGWTDAPPAAAATPPAGWTDAPPTNPMDEVGSAPSGPSPFEPIMQGAQRAAGTGISTAFDLLNRPHEAATAAGTGGLDKLLPTLMHGQSPESQDQTRAEVRKAMGLEGDNPAKFYKLFGQKPVPKGSRYQELPHWQQGLEDFLVDTVNDPATYAGGAGILNHIMEQVGMRGFPAFARIVNTMQQSANPAVQKAGKIIAGAHDFANYKGEAKRALAAQSGAEGLTQYKGLKAINTGRRSVAGDLSNELVHRFHDVIAGLTPAEEGQLYEAVHTGTVANLPPNLAMRAQSFKQITDTLAHLSGNKELQQHLAARGFSLPESMKRFASAQPRDLQGVTQFREAYVPVAHELGDLPKDGIAALDETMHAGASDLKSILDTPREKTARQTAGLTSDDRNLLPREGAGSMLQPELQRKVIAARLASGAQAVAAKDAEKRVSELFGKGSFAQVPARAKEFFRETYTSPENKEWWHHLSDVYRGAIDVPKIGLFALPFRHMANIGTLSVLADPSIANITGTAGRFARLMLAGTNAEQRAKILGDAVQHGVSGSPSIDRTAGGWIGNITPRAAIEAATKAGMVTPGKWSGWLGKVPGIGDIYKLSNHALWAFDDAAKATRFERLRTAYMKKGLDATKAAYHAASDVSAELIDYSNRSPLTQALANVAPFATYRSKLPGAIARSVTRHPERTLAAGRAAPELVGDEQDAGMDSRGNAQVGKSFLPLAETLRGVDNPFAYARSTAGWPLQMLASGMGIHPPSDTGANYPTYHKSPDAGYALNATVGSFPGGDALMRLAGINEFAPQDGANAFIRAQTGFGLTRGPSPKEIAAARAVEMFKQQIAEAESQHDKETAARLRRKLATFLRYNPTYEK